MRKICAVLFTAAVQHKIYHNLAAGKTGADQNMPHQTFAGGFIVWSNFIFFHKGQNGLQNLLILFVSKITIGIGDNRMAVPGIKSGHRFPVLVRTHGILRFVPVAVRIIHAYNRFHNPVYKPLLKTAQTDQVIPYFILLKFQLFFIRKRLKLAAAALPVKRTFWLHAKRRRHSYLL